MLLKSIKAQSNTDDPPTPTEVEFMLHNGVSPLVPSPEHPGFLKIVSSTTTKHKDGTGFNYAARKTKVVTVNDHVAATWRARVNTKYLAAGYKLRPTTPTGLRCRSRSWSRPRSCARTVSTCFACTRRTGSS
jgi:hypothetical protein